MAREFRIARIGRAVGKGVGGALHADLPAIIKKNSTNAPYAVANELVCAEVAHYLRLPVPPAAICRDFTGSGDPYFASLDFNLQFGDEPPPVDADDVLGLDLRCATGVLLFDIVVANCDRNRLNLAIVDAGQRQELMAFDHGHALLGYHERRGVERLKMHWDGLGISWEQGNQLDSGRNRHCLLDHISDDRHFLAWFERIGSIPDFLIEESGTAARRLGASSEESDKAIAFLKHRRSSLPSIIDRHRAEFSAMMSWSLFT